MTSPRLERTETLLYVTGYLLALMLTCAAFALVWLQWMSGRAAFFTVLGLGLVQMLVHFRCFLHIDLKRNARPDLLLLLFSSLIILLMVGGTLVVLFNLHHRMM
ncbi:cytochrome o ubiquinol oxidase subunit IV [Roseomonas haemaphysalidis]|uniref:Cytochrome bo(3) ubiquinol oxidase subunit 4 n=1 Tax=Roseomonas haemaphysalidis TaxID=2768162 RepID=A0ABS3KKG1_9PROT|nr:cytochrome C oxidase subunit IV family protein [Roseomonas haemaphysalidis]MBO1077953.1 cytochrome C oxidase subunit IV family protein [Roseomonas haemaphysalidis]